MVAVFPNFSKVTLEDKQFFDDFNAQFPPYADWAFGTLMTWWDAFEDLEASRIGDNIIIKSSYLSMGKEKRLVLLGSNFIDESIEIIFNYLHEHNLPTELYSLPEYTINAIKNPDKYLIVADPNAAEYIVPVHQYSTLEGGRMAKFRVKIHQFEKNNTSIEYATHSLDSIPAKMLLINSLHTWRGLYKNDSERLEGAAIDRALLIAEYIDLEALCLFINKNLEGFALYKTLHSGHADINHIKVSSRSPNMFNYMVHLLAECFSQADIQYMNFEQDLGIEGLRIYKQCLHPSSMLKKYNIYPR